jgi:hypothetical protein
MSAFVPISSRVQGVPVTRRMTTIGRIAFFKLDVANPSPTQLRNVATCSDTVRELAGLADDASPFAAQEFQLRHPDRASALKRPTARRGRHVQSR